MKSVSNQVWIDADGDFIDKHHCESLHESIFASDHELNRGIYQAARQLQIFERLQY